MEWGGAPVVAECFVGMSPTTVTETHFSRRVLAQLSKPSVVQRSGVNIPKEAAQAKCSRRNLHSTSQFLELRMQRKPALSLSDFPTSYPHSRAFSRLDTRC
ncbi:hypothetical protein R1flu_000649 [Riccia fluitans]|uniref:Uncharacterized protein n=1 Tax=Riccia fluitans TaxID=41844 RepID=A0ABD1Y113_9MARC